MPILDVTGSGLRYVLADHPKAPGQLFKLTRHLTGRDVDVKGELPEEAGDGGSSRVLRVRSFSPSDDGS